MSEEIKQKTIEELRAELTEKERLFCHQYIIDWNGARSARVAGYSVNCCKEIASEIIRKPHIKNYIKLILPAHQEEKLRKANENKAKNIGHIYIIKLIGTHYYKIGKTLNGGKQRLQLMQTGIPLDLELCFDEVFSGYDKKEKHLHNKFKEYWVRGEWFVFSDHTLREVINYLKLLNHGEN